MKTTAKWLAAGLLTVGMVGTAKMAFGQYAQPQQGYDQGRRDWDDGPRNYEQDFQQRGFRDGFDGARKDYENHRRPNVRNRDEFRDPDFIPRPYRHEYQEGFERGYWTGVRRLIGERDQDDWR